MQLCGQQSFLQAGHLRLKGRRSLYLSARRGSYPTSAVRPLPHHHPPAALLLLHWAAIISVRAVTHAAG